MILEVKQWPVSQDIMDDPDWFPIGEYGEKVIIGDSAYARIMDKSEYILVEKTTADEFNNETKATINNEY